MHSHTPIITSIIILYNIYLGSSIEILSASEGQFVVVQCRFNIKSYDADKLETFWLYPTDYDESGRINYDTVIQGNSLLTYLVVRNVTKNKDAGNYSCILNNNAQFLTEKRFILEVSNVITTTTAAAVADEVDSPTLNFNAPSNVIPVNLMQDETVNNKHKIQNTENIHMKETTSSDANTIIPIIAGVSGFIIAVLFVLVIALVIIVRRKLARKPSTV